MCDDSSWTPTTFSSQAMLQPASHFDLGDQDAFMPTLNSNIPFQTVSQQLPSAQIPCHPSSFGPPTRLDHTMATHGFYQQEPFLLPPSYSQLFAQSTHQTTGNSGHGTSAGQPFHQHLHSDEFTIQPPTSSAIPSAMRLDTSEPLTLPAPARSLRAYECMSPEKAQQSIAPNMFRTEDERVNNTNEQEQTHALNNFEYAGKKTTGKRKMEAMPVADLSLITGMCNALSIPVEYGSPGSYLHSPPLKRTKGSARPTVNPKEVDIGELRKTLYHNLSSTTTELLTSDNISDAAASAFKNELSDDIKSNTRLTASPVTCNTLTGDVNRDEVDISDESQVEDAFTKLVSCAEDACEHTKVQLRSRWRGEVQNCTPQEASKIEARLSRVNKNVYALSLEEILKVALREIVTLKRVVACQPTENDYADVTGGHQYIIRQQQTSQHHYRFM